ncbi:hypothetical protein M378DRAFT_87819 [Amanita muscaria Koide BX008]|uniref:PSP1 C-terminal domain-containing protein n=1 Tax=Amanita muscaria (strain Koide BX008) TaxID=946122 RepID=A0A0C2S4C1_AMAMK|nr:hypothetical protein M378DRAFT_87819 [Amanita muscaria Koide BX008]
MVKPQQSLAYLDHYSQQHGESETHGITSSTSTSTTARTSALNLTTNPHSGASNPSLNPTDLGKGIPLHSVPSSCPLFIVEFKAGRTDLYYLSDQKMDVRVGDWIIVEADRGRDLGKVVSEGITAREVELWHSRKAAKAQAQQEINPKMIYAKAGPQDIETLAAKLGDEMKALQLCQTKVRATRLPIEVIDAEYQWDRRKLTFYFVGEKNIDFRELVRELFRLYKTRIWMASLPEYEQR